MEQIILFIRNLKVFFTYKGNLQMVTFGEAKQNVVLICSNTNESHS
jgi:hypothetical protein